MRLKELAYTRVSYGYRRLHILLLREGWQINHKRVYRIYKEEGLTLKRRKPKRYRSLVARHVREQAGGVDDIWTMDFMSDQLADGRRFRVLTVVDVYSRECLALVAGQRMTGADVVEALTELAVDRNAPKYIHCDNGSEFTSRIMDKWAWFNGVRLDFSRPGKPTDNAYIESFNGRVRQECLSLHWFTNLDEVRAALELWKLDYNMERPHSALGNQSPHEYATRYRKECQPDKAMKRLELA